MSGKEIQTTVAELFISKAYRLIGIRVDKPLPLQTVFFTFEVPYFPPSMSGMKGFQFAHMFPTLCIASDARNFDTLNRGVRLTLSVAIMVRKGTVRNLVPIRLTALIVLECMHLATESSPFTWMRRPFKNSG
jgi:hypothetical protein